MTTVTIPTTSIATTETGTTGHRVRRATVVSGAAAAVATSAAAAVADAASVPFAIDGETIPLAGFAQMSVIGAALGGLIAAACNRLAAQPRRLLVAVAVVLTALSCLPSVALPPTPPRSPSSPRTSSRPSSSSPPSSASSGSEPQRRT